MPRTPRLPRHLAKNDLPLLLQQLDQFWDLAPEPVLAQIRNVLTESDQPLAREAAARALGHMADPGAMPVLIKGLGDPTKMVQTSSAYALRMVLRAGRRQRQQDANCWPRRWHRPTRAPVGERPGSSISISGI